MIWSYNCISTHRSVILFCGHGDDIDSDKKIFSVVINEELTVNRIDLQNTQGGERSVVVSLSKASRGSTVAHS